MMKLKMILAMATFGMLVAASDSAAARQIDEARIDGSWTASFNAEENVDLRIRISRWSDDSRWDTRISLDRETAARIMEQATRSGGVVNVELVREAGTIVLEGRIDRNRGRGEFSFDEDPSFRSDMRDLGYGRLDDDEVFSAAVLDVGPRRAREAEMGRAGFDGLDFDELVSFRVFEIDGTFVEEAARLGLSHLDADDLVAMKVHNLTSEAIEDATALNLGDLDFDDLIAMQIHDITPEFVEEANSAGFGALDLDDILAMKIHGLSARFVESMSEVGITLTDLDDALAFRIHDITPEFVREMRDEGFEDLDEEDLLQIRIHGLDDILKKRRRERRN